MLVVMTLLLPAAAATSNRGQIQNGKRQAFEPATTKIESFIKEALEDRLADNDLPDGNLLSSSRRIAVREEMPDAELTLSAAALPQRNG